MKLDYDQETAKGEKALKVKIHLKNCHDFILLKGTVNVNLNQE